MMNVMSAVIRITIYYSLIRSVLIYLVEDYKKDIEGFNVVQSIHVEAIFPGDPVGETV